MRVRWNDMPVRRADSSVETSVSFGLAAASTSGWLRIGCFSG
jgi:hypothetical protein